ncbi:MAG: vWA domain-containing protein [Pirellulaceae bacterium]
MSIDCSPPDTAPPLGSAVPSDEPGERGVVTPGVLEQADAFFEDEEPEGWFNDESYAFAASLLTHMAIVLFLALVPLVPTIDEEAIVIVTSPPDYEQEAIQMIDEITSSDVSHSEVGANSVADTEMAEASAAMFADVAEIPNPVELEPTDLGTIDINTIFQQAVAPLDRLDDRKGKVGEGTQGAAGAVDRITFEILRAMEERPTLVVWLFDRSGSLHRQRQEIRDRFDRIYEELGIVEKSGGKAFTRNAAHKEPLLTSIIGFGENVELLTEEPTADLAEIKATVDSIEVDSSGIERVFSAVYLAADEFKSLRKSRGSNGPQRNVLLIAVTDERGDDAEGLEPSIDLCRRWGMPVHVIGVPAPFGREETYVKYVDPDPEYDQTPQWAQVEQGPETLLPERVQFGFAGGGFTEEPAIDSGFGPYALTRLCYETGGIYFTVHPNRNVNRDVRRGEIAPFASNLKRFFDPATMAPYRPDYVAPADYMKMIKESPMRQALVNAARVSGVGTLEAPQMRFVKRGEAELAAALGTAQQAAARIHPKLTQLHEILKQGEEAREAETSLRWQAGYDLALGTVIAQKIRAETYNAMLAQAKRGMEFKDSENNTWILESSDDISVGSKYQREAEAATELLTRVVQAHAGTPWAVLAENELKTPMGWEWKEAFTDLNPPARNTPGNNNNNNVNTPQDDQKRMLKKAPKRPIPKL